MSPADQRRQTGTRCAFVASSCPREYSIGLSKRAAAPFMTLPGSRIYRERIHKFTSFQSAEVGPNVGGDYSVLVTRTDGRRAISRDLDAANDAHAALQIEESYAQAVYATLGEGNVPVFCSRETWKAWWEENAGGKVVKSEQSGDFVTEVIFTGFPSERDGSRKFWTGRRSQHEDRRALLARKLHYPRGSGCVSGIDQRTKLGEVTVG